MAKGMGRIEGMKTSSGAAGNEEESNVPCYGPSYSELQVDEPGESLEGTPNSESGHILGGPGRGYEDDQKQIMHHDESGSRKHR